MHKMGIDFDVVGLSIDFGGYCPSAKVVIPDNINTQQRKSKPNVDVSNPCHLNSVMSKSLILQLCARLCTNYFFEDHEIKDASRKIQ